MVCFLFGLTLRGLVFVGCCVGLFDFGVGIERRFGFL